jgi:hypothetical protein
LGRLVHGITKPSTRRASIYTKAELIRKLLEIQKKSWIKITAHRQDKDGGLGNTLEDLLGIPENNLPLADYGEFELKTHRSESNSLISLFRFEPKPGRVIPYLVENYGWPIPKYGPKERSLRVDVDAAKFSERGFIARINEELKRVELHFDSSKVPNTTVYQRWLKGVEAKVGLGDLNPIPYWTFKGIENKIKTKIGNMVYVTVDTSHEDRAQKMKIAKAVLLQGADLSNFLDGIRNGWLQIEINARTHHNHGTAFRTWEKYWPLLYDTVEVLIE